MESPSANGSSDSTPSSTAQSHADTTATSIDSTPNLPNGSSQGNSAHGTITPTETDKSQPGIGPRTPGILYRVEYRYDDEELAHEKEGTAEAELLLHRPTPLDVLPPLTITTVYYSSTTREKSKNKKKDKTKTKEGTESKDTAEDKNAASSEKVEEDPLEDFADSRVATAKRMTIRSKKLLNALRDVITYYPGGSFIGDEVNVYEPYRVLCHHIEDLKAYKDRHPEWHDEAYRQECNDHIDILLGFLDDHYGKDFRDEQARWERQPPICTFKYLWLLLKPGESCFRVYDDQSHPFITQEVIAPNGDMVRNKNVKYEIDAWYIGFDGYRVGRCVNTFYISPFDGEKEIRSLKYYPTRFFSESKEINDKNGGKTFDQRLVTRGKKFWALAKMGNCYQEYNGETAERPYKKLQGRVVVDPASYSVRYDFENSNRGTSLACPSIADDGAESDDGKEAGVSEQTGCQCSSCVSNPSKARRDRFEGFSVLYPDEDEPPDNDLFYYLCDHRVFAFMLKSRTWEVLNVADVVDVEEQEQAFHHLVLPEGVKHTLKAIACSYVKAQENARTQNTDIIKGKGEGKIFLLHGPPGTGKTLSAEVVAELTKRPLLPLTCGDLGVTAEEVETRLGRYMSLGESWGAVVLLDEADIYLEARAINEVKRNSLVSVFLRALEYYKGLLFLTTNRVSTFDEAFKSRIHVALEYKRLTNEYRQRIWDNNMDRMESDRIRVTEKARQYVYSDKDVLNLEWNGREIRNALQTAMSLAEFEAEEKGKDVVTIKSSHLEQIVELSTSFQRYIASMHHNKSDSYVAKQKRLRNDFYHDTPSTKSEKNTFAKSKYLIPEEDEEMPKTRTREKNARNAAREQDYDEYERPKARKASAKKSDRALSEDDEDLPRSRSKLLNGRSRQPATIEEESEEEPPRLRKSTRRDPRHEEASEEEAPKPKRTTRRPPRSEDEEEESEVHVSKVKERARRPSKQSIRDEEDDDPPQRTRLTRKSTKAMPVDDEEEEEELPRASKPTRRATANLKGDARYDRNGSISPARAKKGVARKVPKYASESEES